MRDLEAALGRVPHDVWIQLNRLTHAQGTTTLMDQPVDWNPAGAPAQVTTTRAGSEAATTTYTYDAARQLTGVCTPATGTTCPADAATAYTYDLNGNRTATTTPAGSTSSTYDADDRLTATTAGTDTTSYTYGPNGDLTGQTGPGGTRSYDYRVDGNLASVRLEDGRTVSYAYDESGNRISRSVDGTVDAKWTWDTHEAQAVRIRETDAAGKTAHACFADPQSSLGTAAVDMLYPGTWLLEDAQGASPTPPPSVPLA